MFVNLYQLMIVLKLFNTSNLLHRKMAQRQVSETSSTIRVEGNVTDQAVVNVSH